VHIALVVEQLAAQRFVEALDGVFGTARRPFARTGGLLWTDAAVSPRLLVSIPSVMLGSDAQHSQCPLPEAYPTVASCKHCDQTLARFQGVVAA
jgi:hypothetical protein